MVEEKSGRCIRCGTDIDEGVRFCPSCGAYQEEADPGIHERIVIHQSMPEEKSPVLAAILSFLIPGMGQIYVGEVGRGLMFLAGMVVIYGLTIGAIMSSFVCVLIMPVISFGYLVFSVYDAYRLAEDSPYMYR